jgi:dihydrodipicolinate reductase
MRVILFGASGMVGQGVLRECLLDPEVTAVLSIVRNSSGQQHGKLWEIGAIRT